MNKNIDTELPVWPAESEEEKDDNLPRSVVEVVPVDEIEELKGRGNSLARRYIAEIDGIEPFWCYEVWEDGNLISRTYSEYSDPGDLVRDTQIPAIETWYAGGQPYLVVYRPTKEQIEDYFQGDYGDERLVTSKEYFEDGTTSKINYWEQAEDGKLREIRKTFFESGDKKSVITRNLEGKFDSFEGNPAITCYHESGQISVQEWDKDGKYHRESGPAVIEYTQDGQVKVEKYFLDGEEVPGTASLFGYVS